MVRWRKIPSKCLDTEDWKELELNGKLLAFHINNTGSYQTSFRWKFQHWNDQIRYMTQKHLKQICESMIWWQTTEKGQLEGYYNSPVTGKKMMTGNRRIRKLLSYEAIWVYGEYLFIWVLFCPLTSISIINNILTADR